MHLSVTFVDVSYLQGKSKSEWLQDLYGTVILLEAPGFTIHERKSVLEPTQSIEFLVFVIDSIKMTINLNLEEENAILKKIEHFEAKF